MLMFHISFLPLLQVSAGTTPIMSGLTTLSNVIQYSLRGDISIEFGAWFLSIGVVGGFAGRSAAVWISKNFGRPSVTIFSLALVLYVGCVLLLYNTIHEGADMETSSFCHIF